MYLPPGCLRGITIYVDRSGSLRSVSLLGDADSPSSLTDWVGLAARRCQIVAVGSEERFEVVLSEPFTIRPLFFAGQAAVSKVTLHGKDYEQIHPMIV